jgi:RHS repeat-associated protein
MDSKSTSTPRNEGDAKQASSEKTAFSPPSINLPKGGGAIKGIGEKFAANPVTGTGSMSVPIFTSPGRSGFGPQLSLSYDSGSGNGPFGFGWSLSLPSITRKTDKGLPQYRDADESDVFILSGAEDLVPVFKKKADGEWELDENDLHVFDEESRDGYRIRRYRPRIEGLFARIERWTKISDASDVHWRSISKDNILTLYGEDTNSRILDPDDPGRIFSWLICETRDDKGNAVIYKYKAEDGTEVDLSKAHERNRGERNSPQRAANRYLKRIIYGNRVSLLDDAGHRPRFIDDDKVRNADWMFEVVFDYEDHHPAVPKTRDDEEKDEQANLKWPWSCRLDPFSSYRAGFEVRTTRLCQRVLMFHHFNREEGVGNDCLVRSTDFTYSSAGNTVYSFLAAVTQTGYKRDNGGYLPRSLPPVVFEYTKPVVQDTVHDVDPDSIENLPAGLDGTIYQWTDLHGEGIPGILTEQAGAWFYKRNLSPLPVGHDAAESVKARFGPTELVAYKPNLALSGGAQFMDLAGDGQPDLVMMDGPMPGLYEHDGDEDWQPFRPFTWRLNRDMRDPNLKFVDLNGDGHADILITEDDAFVWHPSLAEEGFGPAAGRVAQALDEEKGPRLVFADGTQSIYLADLSGDGLTDLARIRNGEVCYWPNLGYGKFGAKVTMDNAPWFDAPDQFDQKRIRLADIDGSGTTDIIYLHGDGVRLYFNQSGNSWSEPKILSVFPRIDDLVNIMPVDLLGNGTACLVWSSSLPGDAQRPMRYLNLMGDNKPHLLVKTINNLGAETRVHYSPSTKFYLKDKRDGKPWITRLPFPVHVVERVETYDHISRNRFVSSYEYHHGYFDGEEREFRGFGKVDQSDTETFGFFEDEGIVEDAENLNRTSHVPPVLTRTWFHTGAYLERDGIDRYFRENEYYKGDPDAVFLPDTVITDNLSVEEEREACRALKGSMLRQEVYAQDGTGKAKDPYTVTEQNFTFKRLQPKGLNRHAVFFTHAREAVNYHYERNPSDPRVQHALTLEVDSYGNVLKSASIAYGRRKDSEDAVLVQKARDKQRLIHITCTENRFTNAVVDTDTYRTPLPAETCTYELRKPEQEMSQDGSTRLFQFDQLLSHINQAGDGNHDINYEDIDFKKAKDAAANNAGEKEKYFRRLIEHIRTLYRKDDLTALLPLGDLQSLALPGETYKLAFTPGLLAQIYIRNGEPLLPNPAAVLGGQGPDQGGYVRSRDLKAGQLFPNTDPDDYWWIPSGQMFYHPDADTDDPAATAAQELSEAQQHFFLPRKFADPFGNSTTVDYDAPNDLMASKTKDAVGNTVSAINDYRVLQPKEVIDPNNNHTEAAFDALGMLVGTAIKGKIARDGSSESGDSLKNLKTHLTPADLDDFFRAPKSEALKLLGNATTRIIYDLDCYFLPNDSKKIPPYAATLARELHTAMPGGDKSPVQVSFSYSDGFGREIQKKIQAERGKVPLRDETNRIRIDSERQPIMSDDEREARWVGSGWTVFNNKGKPVLQFEPFFTDTHRPDLDARIGVSPVLFYDPVERVIATLHPNHTYEKVVFDPWQQKTYDVNDTVTNNGVETGDPRTDKDIKSCVAEYFKTQPDDWKTWYQQRIGGDKGIHEKNAAKKTAAHANTPTLAHFDSLGRTFLTFADNGPDPAQPDRHLLFATRVELDIEGNQREVIEARGLVVMRYDYYMAGPDQNQEGAPNRIHQVSMDAGDRWMLNDVAGKPIRAWDSRGHTMQTKYDQLRRPTEVWLQEGAAAAIQTDRSIYGELRENPEQANLRGKAWKVYDNAGEVVNELYDFKGNLSRSYRRLVKAYKTIPNWDAGPAMEAESFTSATGYDALNRPIQVIAPYSDKADPKRINMIQPVYSEANLLERVNAWLEREREPAGLLPENTATLPAVKNIDYNAKGQRELIEYGNRVKTRYKYDSLTFRLQSLYTERPAHDFPGDDPNSPNPPRGVQNLSYTYDPAGNITHIEDQAQPRVFFDNDCIEANNDYLYDAIYRLIAATGREHRGDDGPPGWKDESRMGNPIPYDCKAIDRYVEQYRYDNVGNIMEMAHHRGGAVDAPGEVVWRRRYQYSKNNNQLRSTSRPGEDPKPEYSDDPAETYQDKYEHDIHGNMTRMPHLQALNWNYKDQLQSTSPQRVTDPACSAETTYYVYDAAGQRIRKVTECFVQANQQARRTKERIYIGVFEVYREHEADGETIDLERETLHIMDDKQRIALVETRVRGNDDSPAHLIRYQFGNHLGSVSLELNDQAQIISYEEYTPYGSTSYQAGRSTTEVSLKRYRYTGKERDEESGLYYHRARYYAPWLGRWIAVDPAETTLNPGQYIFCSCNPLNRFDSDGCADTDIGSDIIRHELDRYRPELWVQKPEGWPQWQTPQDTGGGRPPDLADLDQAYRQISTWVNAEQKPTDEFERSFEANPSDRMHSDRVIYAINYFIAKANKESQTPSGQFFQGVTRRDILQSAWNNVTMMRQNEELNVSDSILLRDVQRYFWGRIGIEKGKEMPISDIVVEHIIPAGVAELYWFSSKISHLTNAFVEGMLGFDPGIGRATNLPASRPGGTPWFELGIKHYWEIDREKIDSPSRPEYLNESPYDLE